MAGWYLVLGEAGELVAVLASQVEGLGAESAAGALDEATVKVADEFPLEIGRHLWREGGDEHQSPKKNWRLVHEKI